MAMNSSCVQHSMQQGPLVGNPHESLVDRRGCAGRVRSGAQLPAYCRSTRVGRADAIVSRQSALPPENRLTSAQQRSRCTATRRYTILVSSLAESLNNTESSRHAPSHLSCNNEASASLLRLSPARSDSVKLTNSCQLPVAAGTNSQLLISLLMS